ncbi:MAG: phage holin family protein [Eubacteriales bacterium]|nr:phage holin family protein [Eubacteriales bacterium]
MFLLRIAIYMLLVPACAYFLPGMKLLNILNAALVGLCMGCIHAFLRLFIRFLLQAFHAVALFFMAMALDCILLYVAVQVFPHGIEISSILWALACAAILSVAREAAAGIFGN